MTTKDAPPELAASSLEQQLTEIQGGMLSGYRTGRFPAARFVFLEVREPALAREWLGTVAHQVTSAADIRADRTDASGEEPVGMNMAFTHRGLLRLGVPDTIAPRFSQAFREGMRPRHHLLGDPAPLDEPPAPRTADVPWHSGADVMVTLYGQPAELDDAIASLNHAVSGALEVCFVQCSQRLPAPGAADEHYSAYDHFGYRDGISQPLVKGYTPRTGVKDNRLGIPEQSKPASSSDYRPVKAGEFLFGYLSESREIPPVNRRKYGGENAEQDALDDQAFFDFVRNGTYMVWRKLEQDVVAFREYVDKHADAFFAAHPDAFEEVAGRTDHHQLARAFLMAHIVGRWPDGTPLHRARTPAAWLASGGEWMNENLFGFSNGVEANVPRGSHIRRANPRDDGPFSGRLTHRRRMIRRGIPYGPALPEDASSSDGAERGLVFVAFMTNIAGQFELVQREWMNAGEFFGQGADRDPLAGARTPGAANQYVIQRREGPYLLRNLPEFVRFRGGDYFFVPSLTSLRQLASAPSPAAS